MTAITAVIPAQTLARFESKIDKSGECWRWLGHVGRWGYGQFYWDGRVGYAHVFSHLAFLGPVPEGYEVDHVAKRGCRFTDCVNPAHLEAVTKRENTLRGDSVAAKAARKTHCPQGHPYSGKNLYVEPSAGTRRCRVCLSEKQRRAYLRRKGAQ